MARAEAVRVSVAYSPQARGVDETELSLPAGRLADAIRASGVLDRHPELNLAQAKLGIWGRVQTPETVLRERDRVEVYRPLQVDPKEARRLRYRKRGPDQRSR
ncbi:RnfH family protein [Piscinibacter sp.]|uniref:RnfH family protein n=1 Tax=Piscinibacter sp. TaxID=1903157 RepID=UPI001DC488A8|nr:RnfH family protein [Piscinibacter sp.]MBK7529733.1 RnfH family protein [Piscinibacter sp.]